MRMSPELSLVLRFVVGLSFLSSAMIKMLAPALFFDGLRDYRLLPPVTVRYAGTIVIGTEALTAVAYLTGWQSRLFEYVALVLSVVFLMVTGVTLARGLHVKCLCFGASDTEPVSARTLVRVSLLAGVLLLLKSQSPEQESWLGAAYPAGQLLLALACAASIQILTSWALAIPEIIQLIKGCRTCGTQTSEK
jgi:hypothetical protein